MVSGHNLAYERRLQRVQQFKTHRIAKGMAPEIRSTRAGKSSLKALANQENEAIQTQLAATTAAEAQFKPVIDALVVQVGQRTAALQEQKRQNESLKADLICQNEALRADFVG
jgi:hypothetical protein